MFQLFVALFLEVTYQHMLADKTPNERACYTMARHVRMLERRGFIGMVK